MEKRQSALSAPAKRARKSAKHIPDSKIDFSDIPESTDQELKKARRVGRPKKDNAKQLIAIRIDPAVLSRIRRLAESQNKPYQTFINELLEKVAERAA